MREIIECPIYCHPCHDLTEAKEKLDKLTVSHQTVLKLWGLDKKCLCIITEGKRGWEIYTSDGKCLLVTLPYMTSIA